MNNLAKELTHNREEDKLMKTEICTACGREFDPMKEVSAEMEATMKDGSHRKFTLCLYCLTECLNTAPPEQETGG